jgi:hypothetical protein
MKTQDIDKEREELLQEISKLKQQLLWYKRTYEERSLLGVIFERLFGKKRSESSPINRKPRAKFSQKVRIYKSSGSEFVPLQVLCSIVNHNHSENAVALFNTLMPYFDTVILDSGSGKPPANSVKLSNIYYSGLLNEAHSIAKVKGYKYLLFICSDVIIKAEEADKLYQRLKELDYDRVGVYSPASKGGGHFFCKRSPLDGLRIVPFVEGFIFLCDIKVLDKICPIDTKENLYGWGLDIAKGYFSKKMGKVCLIDDSIEVEHLAGTGYSRETAEYEMLSWVRSLNNDEMVAFFEEQVTSIKNHQDSNI